MHKLTLLWKSWQRWYFVTFVSRWISSLFRERWCSEWRLSVLYSMVRFRRQFVLKLTLYFIQTDSVLNRWRRPQRGNTRDPIPNKSELKQIYEQSRRRWASASGRSSCPECRIAKLLQLVRKIPFTSLSNPSHPVCTQQISYRIRTFLPRGPDRHLRGGEVELWEWESLENNHF